MSMQLILIETVWEVLPGDRHDTSNKQTLNCSALDALQNTALFPTQVSKTMLKVLPHTKKKT